MAIKRLHYFDHQFLVQADFSDEQKYHLDMRRRLNRLLYTFGIAEGLAVAKSAPKAVTVRPGVALDRLGQELIVETDQVVDLSTVTPPFPPNATVFITIAYQEQESDPTTATGVSGNTRITEQPRIQAVTTAPPTDGSVIQLARFTLDPTANVPGNNNDLFDGGVRQTVAPRSGQGLASLDGVSNPGGNIDLVQAQAIVINSNDANNQITIGETHSTRTGNVHTLGASDLQQIGALLVSDYDLRRRQMANITFNQQDGLNAPAPRTVPIGFQTRIVFVVGTCIATLGTRVYGSGVTAFADATNLNTQRGFGISISRTSNTDWVSRPLDVDGIAGAIFINNEVNPPQGENLTVAITNVSATDITATLTRSLTAPTNARLPGFAITLRLLCMG